MMSLSLEQLCRGEEVKENSRLENAGITME